jgi:hypothetical protein
MTNHWQRQQQRQQQRDAQLALACTNMCSETVATGVQADG